MEFNRVGGCGSVLSWASDNDMCEIRVYLHAFSVAGWLFMSFRISDTQNTSTGIYFAKDGVVSFLIQELMNIAGKHQGAVTVDAIRSQITEFKIQLRSPVTLRRFSRYAVSLRRST